jgi:hypothetical protein
MSRDLTIRLLGRPQVTVDKRTGFSKVSRRYVVQGPRATLAGISDATNPLFLAAGTADEEFTDYYLVDQSLAPASGTLDKAYLVREYLQLSSSAITEAFQQSNDLIRVRKRFAVLRNDDANLGYGSSWSNHPNQATTYAQDPWEYAPSWVANATPGSRNYTVDNADDDTQHGFTDAPQIDGQNLGTYIQSHASTGEWLKGYAVMSQAGSGLDIWTVEWVTHAPPYWQLGTGSGRASRSTAVTVVDFNEHGILLDSTGSSGSVSYTTRIMSYTFFVKGTSIPSDLAKFGGGSGQFKFSPTVNFNLAVTDTEGKTTFLDNRIPNAVWNGPQTLTLSGVEVATTLGNTMTFDHEVLPQMDSNYPDKQVPIWDKDLLIDFKGYKAAKIKGVISWTMTKDSFSANSSSGTFGQTRTQIAPIFSHGSEKIWKVAITYVGG